jgi:hypothetical protein
VAFAQEGLEDHEEIEVHPSEIDFMHRHDE